MRKNFDRKKRAEFHLKQNFDDILKETKYNNERNSEKYFVTVLNKHKCILLIIFYMRIIIWSIITYTQEQNYTGSYWRNFLSKNLKISFQEMLAEMMKFRITQKVNG